MSDTFASFLIGLLAVDDQNLAYLIIV
jgi:hypothetical protein